MQIRVKLFATLAAHVPQARAGEPMDVTLPEGATLEVLIGQLALPPGEVRVAFVNGRARPLHWELHAGDELGLFPAIGGG